MGKLILFQAMMEGEGKAKPARIILPSSENSSMEGLLRCEEYFGVVKHSSIRVPPRFLRISISLLLVAILSTGRNFVFFFDELREIKSNFSAEPTVSSNLTHKAAAHQSARGPRKVTRKVGIHANDPPFSKIDGDFMGYVSKQTNDTQRASIHEVMGYTYGTRMPFDPFGDDPQDKPIRWSGWPTARDLLSVENDDGTENAMNLRLLELGFEIQPMWKLISNGNGTSESDDLGGNKYRNSIENVIVSVYFQMKSKHPQTKYREWIQNFLSLQDPMIIYTEPSMMAFLMQGRRHAINRTVFMVSRAGSEHIDVDPSSPGGIEVSDNGMMDSNSSGTWSLPIRHMYRLLSNETEAFLLENLDRLAPINSTIHTLFWHTQFAMDDHYELHKGPSLYWVWLCKSWMVANAIKLSHQASPLSMAAPIFPSAKVFMYSDIGCFRHEGYNNQLVIRYPERVPKDRMLMKAWSVKWNIRRRRTPPLIPVDRLLNDTSASREDRRIDRYLWNRANHDPFLFFHSGASMIGTVTTWQLYHRRFLQVLDRFARAGLFIGEDQVVQQQTCLAFVDQCVYGVPLKEDDDTWFALRSYVHSKDYGSLWYPPKVDDDF
jgi:hypothetical protein